MPSAALHSTAQSILDEACRQFAERGYHGASIASIAGAVGQSKQVLLHHFGSKEQLYELATAELTNELDSLLERLEEFDDPVAQFEQLLVLSLDEDHIQSAQMIYRDLLDAAEDESQSPITKSYLRWAKILSSYARKLPAFESARPEEINAFVLQQMAATGFFNVAAPALRTSLGPDKFRRMKNAYKKRLVATIEGLR